MNKRLIAFSGVLIIVLSLAFSGCNKKVTQEDTSTTKDDKIILSGGYEGIPDDSQIVIGSDGQSYLVDGEGNSVVYEAPSAYVIPNPVPPSTTTTTTTTKPKPSTPIKVIPAPEAPEPIISQQESIIKDLTSLRREGYNDNNVSEKLPGYKANVLRVKFIDGTNTDWLFEFHKGVYGSSTVGCEAGFYSRLDNNNGYKKISDKANVVCSAQLYNGDNRMTGFSETSVNSGWRYSFVSSELSNAKSSDFTLIATIKLTHDCMILFTDALEELGFAEGPATSSEGAKNYSVDAPKKAGGLYAVTIAW